MFEQEKMTELDAGTAIIKHLLGRNPDICRILITEPSSQSSQGPRAQQPIRPAPGILGTPRREDIWIMLLSSVSGNGGWINVIRRRYSTRPKVVLPPFNYTRRGKTR